MLERHLRDEYSFYAVEGNEDLQEFQGAVSNLPDDKTVSVMRMQTVRAKRGDLIPPEGVQPSVHPAVEDPEIQSWIGEVTEQLPDGLLFVIARED